MKRYINLIKTVQTSNPHDNIFENTKRRNYVTYVMEMLCMLRVYAINILVNVKLLVDKDSKSRRDKKAMVLNDYSAKPEVSTKTYLINYGHSASSEKIYYS